MISYREKQLLSVQKYLIDESSEFANKLCTVKEKMQSDENLEYLFQEKPHFSTFEELAEYVEQQGYDLYIRAEDLLSPEELNELDEHYNEINAQFAKITGLKKADVAFIGVAIGLQVLRQILQPKLDAEVLDHENRDTADQTEKEAKDQYKDASKTVNDKLNNDDIDARHSRYYYASTREILNPKVPYDVTNGTSPYVKLKGNHRYNTLGHDPIAGYLFGTCNILTNTMTLTPAYHLKTFHIKKGKIVARGSFLKALNYSVKHFKQNKIDIVLAILKQFYHIKSDELSKKGLALPFAELFSPETAEELSDMGFDYANVKHVIKTVGRQFELAEMINFIIAITHKLYLFIEDKHLNTSNFESKYSELISPDEVKKVRTKKVILISETIAVSSNIIACSIAAAIGAATENPDMIKKAGENVDLGGIISTILHLFTDGRFIIKLKKEFIEKALERDFEEKLKSLDETTNLELWDENLFD